MNNFDTVREALNHCSARYDSGPALAALAEIERKHYTPADMADAQAKAFRDGVASVTAGQEPVHQFRNPHCSDWYDGVPDHSDGGGPYEERTLYAAPVAQQPQAEWLLGNDAADGAGDRQPQAEGVPPDVVRDAERLDWLLGDGRRMAIDSFGRQYRIVDASCNLVVTDWMPSQREAIDAAIKAERGGA